MRGEMEDTSLMTRWCATQSPKSYIIEKILKHFLCGAKYLPVLS